MLAKKPKGATQKQNSGSLSGLIWMFVGAILTLMIGLFLYLWNPFDMGQTDTQAEPRTVQPKVNTDQDNEYEFYDLLPEQQITSIPDEAIIVDRQSEQDRADSVEPDVVVLVPVPTQSAQEESNNDTRSERGEGDNGQNYGISEETILNPIPERSSDARSREQEGIVVVEEPETYDGADTSSNAGNRSNANNNSTAARSALPKKTYILQINSYTNADEADRRRAQVLMAGVDAKVIKNETANGQTIYQVISNRMTSQQAVASAQQKLQNNGIDSLIVEQRR